MFSPRRSRIVCADSQRAARRGASASASSFGRDLDKKRARKRFCASRDGHWTEADKPLAGKRIVVTRAPEQAGELVAALERLGAEVVCCCRPWRSRPPKISWLLDACAARNWPDSTGFYSPARMRYDFFVQRCRSSLDLPAAIAANRRGGSRAARDCEAARQEGFRVDYVATNHTGESLAGELAADRSRQAQVLLPRSDRAAIQRCRPGAARSGRRGDRSHCLSHRCAESARSGSAATTCATRKSTRLFSPARPHFTICAMDFCAPEAGRTCRKRVQFAAIGPTTARAMREAGVRVEIEAAEASAAALADAIASYYRREQSTLLARRA